MGDETPLSPTATSPGSSGADSRLGSPTSPVSAAASENQKVNGTAAPAAASLGKEKDAEALKAKANDLYKTGNYADAIELYTEAFEVSGNPTLLLNRAAAYLMLRQYSEALQDSQRVWDKDPANVKAVVRSAKALCGLGRVEEAEKMLKDGKRTVDHAGIKELDKEVI